MRVLAALAFVVFGISACGSAPETEDVSASTSSALTCSGYDPTVASRMAAAASKREGHPSQHLCYAYVKDALASAGVDVASDIAPYKYAVSAYEFAKWANENPKELAAAGLAKIDIGNGAPPKGAILVWGRGVCGYSQKHGHIEIVENDDGSRACSDFCGRVRHGCGKPTVFIPIKKGQSAVGAGCSGGDAGSEAAPQKDSCTGKAEGWYCSQLAAYSAYHCLPMSTGELIIGGGFQCLKTEHCQAVGASGAARLGSDGNPACGAGQ